MPQDFRRTLAPLVLTSLLTAGTTVTAAGQEAPHPAANLARVLAGVGTFTPLILAHEGNDSLGLFLGGMILGPLPGYAYAGELRSGLTQAAIRTAVFGAGHGGLVLICSTSRCNVWEDGGQGVAASALTHALPRLGTVPRAWEPIDAIAGEILLPAVRAELPRNERASAPARPSPVGQRLHPCSRGMMLAC